LPAEHFDAAPALLIFTISLLLLFIYCASWQHQKQKNYNTLIQCPSLITAVPACCLVMTLSPSFVSHNQAVWARAAGTDWRKSAVDVTSCATHVDVHSYSFWPLYSSEYEYTIWSTIRHRSEYEVNIRYIPIQNLRLLWKLLTLSDGYHLSLLWSILYMCIPMLCNNVCVALFLSSLYLLAELNWLSRHVGMCSCICRVIINFSVCFELTK